VLQIVIDTNVLVAALRSKRGAAYRLLKSVGDNRWRANLSVPLLLEYEDVVKRPGSGISLSPREMMTSSISFARRRTCEKFSTCGDPSCLTRRTISF
jgi:predicted nucleic acid-binding protein